MMTHRAWILLVMPLAAACGLGTPTGPLPRDGLQVLIIGNSLTYTNDLPATLNAMAVAAGDTVRVRGVTGPGLALIDHLTGATNAIDVMGERPWHVIVLQQGPTPAGICRDSLVLWTTMFQPYAAGAGADLALFMTWPTSAGSPAFFDQVRVSYEEAARAVGGTFLPAGEAWRAAWAADPTLALYSGDGFHPSPLGSFLAALEIYERLTGRDARTLPAAAFNAGRPMTVPAATIRLLQEAAHEANTRFPAHPAPAARVAVGGAATC